MNNYIYVIPMRTLKKIIENQDEDDIKCETHQLDQTQVCLENEIKKLHEKNSDLKQHNRSLMEVIKDIHSSANESHKEELEDQIYTIIQRLESVEGQLKKQDDILQKINKLFKSQKCKETRMRSDWSWEIGPA